MTLIRPLAILSSLLLTAALFSGYLLIRQRQQEISTPQSGEQAPALSPPSLLIFENEALLRGPKAIVSGTVQNISDRSLDNLTVELELRVRRGKRTEMRQIAIDPPRLASGEQGRYSLALTSAEWSGARLVRLYNGEGDVAFRSEPGARRPPEPPPAAQTKVINRGTQKQRGRNEEFINTPETPVRIP